MTHPSLVLLIEGVRRILRRRTGAALALSLAGLVGLVLIAAWTFVGSDGWGAGTPVPLLLLLAGFLGAALLAALALGQLRRWTKEPRLASEIERSARLPAGSVLAQSELLRSLPPGVSGSLALAGERVLLARLTATPAELTGDPGRRLDRWMRFAGAGSVVVVLAVALLLVLTPDRARLAWAGLATPGSLLRGSAFPALGILPGDAELPRGESPRLDVQAMGRDSVTIHWQEVGQIGQEMTVGVAEGRAEALLPPLQAEVRYWATAPDGARTSEHLLTPRDPSLLAELRIEALYPPHTGMPTELFNGIPERLVLPEGTVLTLAGTLQGEGSEVALFGDAEEAEVRLPVEAGRFTGRWRPLRTERVRWVVDGGREGALLPPPLEVEILPDGAPLLSFPVPGADGELPLSLRVPLLIEATDDYGVDWIEIESMLRAPDGTTTEPVLDRVGTNARTTVTLRSVLDFGSWNIAPGDEVLLRARASDNAPNPRIVETRIFTLRMPLAEEIRELSRGRIDEAVQRTEELLAQAEREAQELRAMEREERLRRTQPASAAAPRDDFAQREEIREALERQAEMARQVDEIRERLEEGREALQEADEPGLQERIEALEELLEEVLGPEARERLEALLESLRAGELPETPGEILGEMAERQEGMQSRLEQALERLRRSALEESMRGAEEEITSLQESQQALVDSLAAGEGRETQEALARRTEALEQRLTDLEDRLRTGGDEAAADGAAETNEQVAQAQEAMQQAAEQSQQGNAPEASQSAQDAAQALQEAAETIQETQSDFADEFQNETDAALRRGAQGALALARRQGELQEGFENAGPIRRGEFEGDEAALREGLQNLASELAAATSQNPGLAELISDVLGRAGAAVDEAMEGLRQGGTVQPGTIGAAALAQEALQQAALLALSGMGTGAEGTPAAAGGSSADILAQLEAVAQAQQSINRDARALGQDPGSDGRTARIEELARTQETIAGSLGDLSQEPGAGGLPGNLEALREEAIELAEELSGGRLDVTTLDRQDVLLDRLLTAGRTLERDGPTEEREGTRAEFVERRLVSPLPEYLLEVLSIPFPTPRELDTLSPAERRLVVDYFERVNRRQTGGGTP